MVGEAEQAARASSAHEHLGRCADCRAWLEDWRLLQSGLRALAAEPVPETTPGFQARLLRRLEEAREGQRAAFDFFERAGRRVVWATLALALAVLLALALPSSGPLRGAEEPEFLLPQPALASVRGTMIVDVDAPDTNAPGSLPAGAGRQK